MSTAIFIAAAADAFPRTGLEHPQRAVLDGEFDVLRIFVVRF